MQLSCIIYYSELNPSVPLDLRALLAVCRHNNERDAITGFLFFDQTYFIQVIEGEREQVSDLYNKIAVDRRHRRVVLISCVKAEDRAFPGWLMGLREGMGEKTKAAFQAALGSHEVDPLTVDGGLLLAAMQQVALDVLAEMSTDPAA